MGNVIPTETRDAYISRVAAMNAGIPKETTSETVNKVCASGLRAAVILDQAIRGGDVEVGVGGGMESMSGAPYLLPQARFGYRMGDATTLERLFHDKLSYGHSNASRETKSSLLTKIAAGVLDYGRIDHPISDILFSGDTAVVVGPMIASVRSADTLLATPNPIQPMITPAIPPCEDMPPSHSRSTANGSGEVPR